MDILRIKPRQDVVGTVYESERVAGFIPKEESLRIIINNKEFVTLLGTPTDIKELVVGFLFTQRIIKTRDDIASINISNKVGLLVDVELRLEILPLTEMLSPVITSGCGGGIMFKETSLPIHLLEDSIHVSSSIIVRLMRSFLSCSNRNGVHFAALAVGHNQQSIDQLLIIKEDIGRHNAIDKVLGAGLINEIDFKDKILLTTGRISSEMILKAIRAEIPIVVARSCPTSLAIKLAETGGITMIGHASYKRGSTSEGIAGSINVYTHQRRITEATDYQKKTSLASPRKSLQERIRKLKEEKNAIILAHNYQRGEVQDTADFVGDSLDLSRKAADTDAEMIVFCGVHFMAQTAKILSPDKIVLLPDMNAGCPMADMITVKELRDLKAKYPDAVVVSYVNTHADIKAESDYCCTSANGVKIINSLPDTQKIIFTPDKYLGDYIVRQTNRKLILWNGYCPTHLKILPEDIKQLKEKYPQAKVIVHPECPPEIIAIADQALSTNQMCKYVAEVSDNEFIIGTEIGIIHRFKKENPQKHFYPASNRAVCPNMKSITLEKVLWALEEERYKIEVPEEIAQLARKSIDRMLAIV